MKAVMISIQPKWCELIARGEKTIVVRKTKPNIETPFKCYIYCTYGKGLIGNNDKIMPNFLFDRTINKSNICGNCCNGKVIGEFVCDNINEFKVFDNATVQNWNYYNLEDSCLTYDELANYIGFEKFGYAWHISDLKIYDEPKELSEFRMNKCPSARQDEYDGTWYCEEVDGENAVVDKTKQFPYDEECIYFDCPSCGGENYENEEYAFCTCNGYKPFTRPPRSWQYCEELEENKNE